MVTKAKRSIVEGVVEVCCHRVSWWVEIGRVKRTDELAERIEEHAEERAKECIIDGCSSGELNYYHVSDAGKDYELRGWWAIERN